MKDHTMTTHITLPTLTAVTHSNMLHIEAEHPETTPLQRDGLNMFTTYTTQLEHELDARHIHAAGHTLTELITLTHELIAAKLDDCIISDLFAVIGLTTIYLTEYGTHHHSQDTPA